LALLGLARFAEAEDDSFRVTPDLIFLATFLFLADTGLLEGLVLALDLAALFFTGDGLGMENLLYLFEN
jgi:hypothetical protein